MVSSRVWLFRRRNVFIGLVILIIVLTLLGRLQLNNPQTLVQNYILRQGEDYQGDLNLIVNQLVLEPNSTIKGNVSFVVLESAALSGTIQGNVSLLAPSVDVLLADGLSVHGTLSICARTLSKSDKVHVTGQFSTGCNQVGQALTAYQLPTELKQTYIPFLNSQRDLGQLLLEAGLMGALGWLLMRFLPVQYHRILDAVTASTPTAGGIGVLSLVTLIASLGVYLLLCLITLGVLCILLPVVAVLGAIVAIGLNVGWIVIGYPIGGWILRRLNRSYSAPVTAGIGAFSLTLGQGLLLYIPCVGQIIGLILGVVGFGGVLLTRFGSRPHIQRVMLAPRPQLPFKTKSDVDELDLLDRIEQDLSH